MDDTCKPTSSCEALTLPRAVRPAWRQRLVDVERGLMQGVRSDSTFFVYFFLSSVTIAASVVLGLSLQKWTIVLLSLTLVLSAEMFNQALKSLCACSERPHDGSAAAALKMGTAAVFFAILGSVIVIALTLGQAGLEMFQKL